jgi:hypothetical protein
MLDVGSVIPRETYSGFKIPEGLTGVAAEAFHVLETLGKLDSVRLPL